MNISKADLKYFNKLFAKTIFPLLFKCNFLLPKCSSFMFVLSTKSIFFWAQKFYSLLLTFTTFLSRSFLSFLAIKLGKITFVFGDICLTYLIIFFAQFKELIQFVISFAPARTIKQSGLSAIKASISSTIFSLCLQKNS